MVENEVLKVILLGNGGVGKSSLMRRYVNNVFEESSLQTIGVEFLNKRTTVQGRNFDLQIWDTGGQERFKSLRTPFYRGSDVCILVFDLTDRESFLELDYWRDEFLKFSMLEAADTPHFPFLLLGNKSDLAVGQGGAVCAAEAVGWCEDRGGVPFFECSAKTDLNVERGFQRVIEGVIEVERLGLRAVTGQYTKTIKLTRQPSRRKRECCKKS